MEVQHKHSSVAKTRGSSRSSSTDSLESRSSEGTSIRGDLPTTTSLGNLASLPIEIIYSMFETMDPYTAIGFALTNKTNLSIYTQWLDTTSSLWVPGGEPGIQEMFDYVRRKICKTATSEQRQDAAAVLRLWQQKYLQNRSPLKRWNVCNGCLEFKQDHCTACVNKTRGTFVGHPHYAPWWALDD